MQTAARQIAELLAALEGLDTPSLRRPCPGREKLGDGTVGAAAAHTVENYRLIADFVAAGARLTESRRSGERGHRRPRLLARAGHTRTDHSSVHGERYAAGTVDLSALRATLSTARRTLAGIGELSDAQLDQVPPGGSFRFADGERTLQQVLDCLLNHQRHQIDAIRGALG